MQCINLHNTLFAQHKNSMNVDTYCYLIFYTVANGSVSPFVIPLRSSVIFRPNGSSLVRMT